MDMWAPMRGPSALFLDGIDLLPAVNPDIA
jgi:hypothetical protein